MRRGSQRTLARLRGIPNARARTYSEPAGSSAQSPGAGGEPTVAMGARTFHPDGPGCRRPFLGTTQEPALPAVGDSSRPADFVGVVCRVCLGTAARSRGTETSAEEPARPRRGHAVGRPTGSAYADD